MRMCEQIFKKRQRTNRILYKKRERLNNRRQEADGGY